MGWVSNTWARVKRLPWTGIGVSTVVLSLIPLRSIYPKVIVIDGVAVGLVVIGVFPWLRSAIKSIEVAGVGKVELYQVEETGSKVASAGLPGAEEVVVDAAGGPTDEKQSDARGVQDEEEERADPAGSLRPVESSLPDYASDPLSTDESPSSARVDSATRYSEGGVSGLMAAETDRLKRAVDAALNLRTSYDIRAPVNGGLAELAYVRDRMRRALKSLSTQYGIRPMGMSVKGQLTRLRLQGAVSGEQADAIASSFEMVDKVASAVAEPEAVQRAIDIARDVFDSLEFLANKERNRNRRKLRQSLPNMGDKDPEGSNK